MTESPDDVAPLFPLALAPVGSGMHRVLDASGRHVGNLKSIQGQWKFKAVGYAPDGAVEPGGGPFTHRHNALVEQPGAETLAAVLRQNAPSPTTNGPA
ncbi:MAG: hypothetical protein ACK40L_10165 [Hydrogenophaga sp.]